MKASIPICFLHRSAKIQNKTCETVCETTAALGREDSRGSCICQCTTLPIGPAEPLVWHCKTSLLRPRTQQEFRSKMTLHMSLFREADGGRSLALPTMEGIIYHHGHVVWSLMHRFTTHAKVSPCDAHRLATVLQAAGLRPSTSVFMHILICHQL